MKHSIIPALLGITAFASPALAQDHSQHQGHGGDHPPAAEPAPPVESSHDGHRTDPPAKQPVTTTVINTDDLRRPFLPGSGTARLPGREAAMPGLHLMSGEWMFMVHGAVSLQYTDHKGPRGDSKTYVTSMAMATADRRTEWGSIKFSAMASLEPAMNAAGYPNLFATGETAGGLPLVDRQHPHDLFMELSARVDVNVGRGSVFLYGGPVAEPALGPSAFMHRGSASNNPEPPITHHWFDSTHITYGVVTLGYSAPRW
ncbi:MAG: hypothetical protein J0M19_07070, partial [Sphingomonadales bacterium]|nr:hypothetical protein [Sphingomonadales bacterium]